jgi:hypothetical protein
MTSRWHWWSFLTNEEGQPIQNADVSIFLAGTETPVLIYTDEFTSVSASGSPQLKTQQNGYFEFWLPDVSTVDYTTTQKFKVQWDKSGVENGFIDFINIYPQFNEVNELSSDTTKDKTISNNLAYEWEKHRVDDSYYLHGLEEVSLTDPIDTISNKLISNELAFNWNDHKDLRFFSETTSASPSGSTFIIGSSGVSPYFPHGIEPLDFSVDYSTNTAQYWRRNKLISYQQGKAWNDTLGNGQEFNLLRTDGYSAGDTVFHSDNYHFYIAQIDQPEGAVQSVTNESYWLDLTTIDTSNATVEVSGATYDLQTNDGILLVKYTNTGTITITLNIDQCTKDRVVTIKDCDKNANSNNITIDTEGAEQIDNASTFVMNTNNQFIRLVSDGDNWWSC